MLFGSSSFYNLPTSRLFYVPKGSKIAYEEASGGAGL